MLASLSTGASQKLPAAAFVPIAADEAQVPKLDTIDYLKGLRVV